MAAGEERARSEREHRWAVGPGSRAPNPESQTRPVQLYESILILIALFSIVPMIWGYSAPWYRVWLVVVLAGMAWVAVRRLRRTREAIDEQKRKRDQPGGRPPGSP